MIGAKCTLIHDDNQHIDWIFFVITAQYNDLPEDETVGFENVRRVKVQPLSLKNQPIL